MRILGFAIILFLAVITFQCQQDKPGAQVAEVKTDSLMLDLVVDEGVESVIRNCTACHSSKLIAQNRATREGWQGMIKWMQSTQNLWDLGSEEDIILDYLAKNYAPEQGGRRKNLKDIEWYELEGK